MDVLRIGVDLAWSEGRPGRPANESGLVALAEDGTVVDAGWERGLDGVTARILGLADRAGTVVLAVDAPLVVTNPPRTMRECEREVGRRYGRYGFSAYPSHTGLAWLAGVRLRERLEGEDFRTVDGTAPPAPGERVLFECYPNTTIVGAHELGFPSLRPRYKGRDPRLTAALSRETRARTCDLLLARMAALVDADPPMDLRSHPVTLALIETPSPTVDREFKHREDLLDGALCAWTAALWHRHGLDRVQILGLGAPPGPDGRPATIVAPARPEQRARISGPRG